jgi:hypothetical protein
MGLREKRLAIAVFHGILVGFEVVAFLAGLPRPIMPADHLGRVRRISVSGTAARFPDEVA